VAGITLLAILYAQALSRRPQQEGDRGLETTAPGAVCLDRQLRCANQRPDELQAHIQQCADQAATQAQKLQTPRQMPPHRPRCERTDESFVAAEVSLLEAQLLLHRIGRLSPAALFSCACKFRRRPRPGIVERILDRQPTALVQFLTVPGVGEAATGPLTSCAFPLRLRRRGAARAPVAADGSDDARASPMDYRRTSQS
jgi:hypothetical protein